MVSNSKKIKQKPQQEESKWGSTAWKDAFSGSRYCPNCQQKVAPSKKINWLALIIMSIITGGVWLIIYVIYYILFKTKQCPICGYKFSAMNDLIDMYNNKTGKKNSFDKWFETPKGKAISSFGTAKSFKEWTDNLRKVGILNKPKK
ncbi:MAG: hypothetical protein V1734_04430 [Nanoarchaeota archaeon]